MVTGNTVVDAALHMLPGAPERAGRLAELGLEPDGYVLSTFHRPENVDDDEQLRVIFAELDALPLPVLLPLHPRTATRLAGIGRATAGSVRVIDPVGYREFLGLARECAFLVSDSGGVQEEASIVKRPVIVVRALDRTTRGHRHVRRARRLRGPPSAGRDARGPPTCAGLHARLADSPTPYGDGHAGERVAAAILALPA